MRGQEKGMDEGGDPLPSAPECTGNRETMRAVMAAGMIPNNSPGSMIQPKF